MITRYDKNNIKRIQTTPAAMTPSTDAKLDDRPTMPKKKWKDNLLNGSKEVIERCLALSKRDMNMT